MYRKYKGLAIAALLVLMSVFSVSTIAQPAPQRIEIIATQFSFAPGEITLKKGQPVLLVLKSQDVAHGLRVRELNVAVKVNEHGTAQVQFTPQKIGDFVGHCYVFCGRGHGSMVLTFHVVN
jgi:cytochrome c oxidase subunit II